MRRLRFFCLSLAHGVLLSTDVMAPMCFGIVKRHHYSEAECCHSDHCWDAFFTPKRCCEAPGFRIEALNVLGQIVQCMEETPLTGASGLTAYAITGSSDLGRVLHCTARMATVAYDIFGGEGGSAALLAEAMRRHARWRVITFERNVGARFDNFLRVLAPHLPSVLDPEVLSLENFRAAGVRALPEGLTVFHGMPYPVNGSDEVASYSVLSKFRWQGSYLEELCRAAPADLVFLDVISPVVKEWLVLEAICQPRFVAIFNVNLPTMAGWVRDKLMMQGDWAELFTGITIDPSAPYSGPTGEVLLGRRWSLLYRRAQPRQLDPRLPQ